MTPSSDAPLRDAGTTQKTGSSRRVAAEAARALSDARDALDLYRWPTSRDPGKGAALRGPKRLPSYPDATCFRLSPEIRMARSFEANFGTPRTSSPSLGCRSHQRNGASFRLGRDTPEDLAISRCSRRRMRPNRLLLLDSSTTRNRVSWVPGFVDCAFAPSLDRGNECFTTPESLRRACGDFWRWVYWTPVDASTRPCQLRSRASDPSVASRRTDAREPACADRSRSPRPSLPRAREGNATSTARETFPR